MEHAENVYAMTGFIFKNTLSDNGGVTRGVCSVEDGHTHVINVVETSNIVKTETGAEAEGKQLDPESYVSRNFWGFSGNDRITFVNVLEEKFQTFFSETVPVNLLKAEYFLPNIIGEMLSVV